MSSTHCSRRVALLADVRREFERMFGRMLGTPWPDAWPAPRLERSSEAWFPAMDVQDFDRELRLTIEAPGLGRDDSRVDVSDDVLTISGEKRVERREEDGAFRLVERRAGRFERRIALPAGTDTEHVTAEYENGVLTVTIPKRADTSRSRRVEIKSSWFQKLLGRAKKDGNGQSRGASEGQSPTTQRATSGAF